MTKPAHRKHVRSFTVLPKHTNHMSGVIFGGYFMEQIDITCGELCRRALYSSEVKAAFTHKVEIEFCKPARLGDIVFIEAEVAEVRKKALVISFTSHVERLGSGECEEVAFGKLVWVSHEGGVYKNHGLEL